MAIKVWTLSDQFNTAELNANFLELYNQMNVAQSYKPTSSNLGTITSHLAMVKSGIGRYKLEAISGNWTAYTPYTICTLSIQYRPTIEISKDIIMSGGQIVVFKILTSGIVTITPRSTMDGASFKLDETYII